MRAFFLMFKVRAIGRALGAFWTGLSRGELWALSLLALIVGGTFVSGMIWFVRRPLGGGHDLALEGESTFQDDANPYRHLQDANTPQGASS